MNFSIICIYNDKNKLDNFLEEGINVQENINFEKIYINNSNGKFKNAKEALLEASKSANGKYLVYMHQDILLEDKNTLKEIYDYLEEYGDFGVAGVAGQLNSSVISNILHGKDKIRVSKEVLTEIKEVNSVDECLFIIKNDNYKKYTFDNLICNTWHLYAVEYSLFMKQNNKQVIVLPTNNIYHASKGASMNWTYYKQIIEIVKKYGKSYKRIDTTLGRWYTNPILLLMQIIKKEIRGYKDLKL